MGRKNTTSFKFDSKITRLLTAMEAFLLVFLAYSLVVNGFFNFNSAKEKEVPSDYVRGAPEGNAVYLKTSQAPFTCLDSSAVLEYTSVNDNYCDCTDGSDEPGTSACHYGQFICRNKGHKAIRLPSSRVDDGICDCCDGSDETLNTSRSNNACPNTCEAQSKEEFERFRAYHEEYYQGKKIRDQYYSDVARHVLDQQFKLETLRAEGKELTKSVSSKEAEVLKLKESQRGRQQEAAAGATARLESLLDIETMSISDLLSFSVILLDANEIKVSDVNYLRNRFELNEKWDGSEEYHKSDEAHDFGEDDDKDMIGEEREDTDEDSESEAGVILDGDESGSDNESPNSCLSAELTDDARLKHIVCWIDEAEASNLPAHLRKLIFFLIRSTQAYHKIELVIGYFRLHGNLDNVSAFLNQNLFNEEDTCAVEFASVGEVCQLSHRLKVLSSEADEESDAYLDELKHAKEALQGVQTQLAENKKARREIKKFLRYHETLAAVGMQGILALNKKCFDAADGKFTYSVCIMEGVYQTEAGGSGARVTLGQANDMEEMADGRISMRFDKGQSCHVFGARTASVTLSCGTTNVVEEAREPSTCTYSFKMKSPLACSPKHAAAIGLRT